MNLLTRYKIKEILLGILWIIIGFGSTVLLIAAVKKNDAMKCAGLNIQISGVSKNYFIDKNDVENIISEYAGNQIKGMPTENFDLKKMEKALENNIWIKNAEIFFNNNNVLEVIINEREPLARVFTVGGSTFYIDSSLMILPLSEKFSARVPLFTGFPAEVNMLKKVDSGLLKDIKILSTEIQQDAFLMGMIEQVDITNQKYFEMIPKIGNQLIVFGDAVDAKEKFRKLRLFYKTILVKTGWNYYSVINLQYKAQVVGKIRGAEDITSDSLRTVQMMQIIAANTEKMASDSIKTFAQDSEKNTADSTMILHSIQRDEATESYMPETMIDNPGIQGINETQKEQPKVKLKIEEKNNAIKPVAVKKKSPEVKKPKAIMEKKPLYNNDY